MSTAVSQIDLTGVPTTALSQLATHRAREAGGRISGKSLCMQVSMTRIKYCSPEECLHKLKGKQILSKSPEISRPSQ